MKVICSEIDGGVIIKLEGKMMLGYEANDFQNSVLDAIEQNRKNIIIDLGEVEFISSWGIGILVYGYTTTIKNEGNFRLARVPKRVEDTLTKVKLDKVFEQCDLIEDTING